MSLPPTSEEQQNVVDAIKDNFNVLCNAEAGAGKSTTAYHAASAWLKQNPDKMVLQVCFNVVLRSEAELRVKKLELPIDCYTIHGLASHISGTVISDTLSLCEYLKAPDSVNLPHQYGLIIVDEAQDLSKEMIDVINLVHQHLNDSPQYLIVGDDRQEIYAYSRSEGVDALKSPETALHTNGRMWKRCPLLRSYRLTVPVCAFINNAMRHPSQPIIEAGNTKNMLKEPIYAICDLRQTAQLCMLIKEMIEKYGAGNIMVLAPTVESDMYAAQKIAKVLRRIPGLVIYSTHKQRVEVVHEMIDGKLFLSTYHQSKGYERDCVIVLGMDELAWSMGEDRYKNDPVVSNALHVACTRAKEQLVLVQSSESNPHPALNMDAVRRYAEYRIMSPEQPRPLWKKDSKIKKTRSWAWVTKFTKTEILCDIWSAIEVSKDPIRLGPPTSTQPKSLVTINDNMEDVSDYFPTAILAAAEHVLLKERAQGKRVRCNVVQAVIAYKYTGDMPLEFKKMRDVLVQYDAPEGPSGWLAVAAMYKALVIHKYPHELQHLSTFSWVGKNEINYFTHCVNNLLKALRPCMTNLAYFNEKRTYMCLKHNVLVENYAPFVVHQEVGVETPWIFTFSDKCNEFSLLRAVTTLCAHRLERLNIFCVSSNTLHIVKSKGIQKISDYVDKLIENRLG